MWVTATYVCYFSSPTFFGLFDYLQGLNLMLQNTEDFEDEVNKRNSLCFFVIKIRNDLEEGFKIFTKM